MLLLTSTTMASAMPSVLSRLPRSGQRGPASASTIASKPRREK